MSESTNRRDFLKAGAAATVAAGAVLPTAHAAGNDVIKVGLIGCGGRGSGAIVNAIQADKSVQFYACGDVFEDRAKRKAGQIQEAYPEQVNLGERVFGGLDAYKQVLASGVDIVILATPPGFRPYHLEAAVEAGKHIFTEKPVAVDGPGIRKCLEVAEAAKKKNLHIVAGTQRRHQAGYIETIKQIQDGGIGDIIATRCSWNNQGIWFNNREPNVSDVVYQLKNWYHFLWLCGDHIVEQHVHNLDVINWVMNAHPVKAVGQGGRLYRKPGDPNEVGHIYDHFAIEYTFPNGVPMYSYCAHIAGSTNDVSETVFGSKGNSKVNNYMVGDKKVFGKDPISPYVQEHIDLIQSIKNGKVINELQQVAESTLTAIMGRMAAYSGETVTWEAALNSTETTMPENLTLDMANKVPGTPVPGVYKVSRTNAPKPKGKGKKKN